MTLALLQTVPVHLQFSYFPCLPPTLSSRGLPGKNNVRCPCAHSISSKLAARHVLPGLAASLIFISGIDQSIAANYHQGNICQLANAADSPVTLPLDKGFDGGKKLIMMRGMTAKDFDPIRYSGRWFEVASLKGGFAGTGQEDCHCTQVNVKGAFIQLIWRHHLSKLIRFVSMEAQMDILLA